MNLRGNILVRAPQIAVWECLLDVDRFSSCLPGVEQLRKLDDRTFEGVIKASVGPMSGTFSFEAKIASSDPPNELSTRVTGTDSVTKSRMKADLWLNLAAVEPGQTELTYLAEIDIHGRLAILGDMVLRGAATVMLQEFSKRLRAQVEAADSISNA